jgi:hypothetical protein
VTTLKRAQITWRPGNKAEELEFVGKVAKTHTYMFAWSAHYVPYT